MPVIGFCLDHFVHLPPKRRRPTPDARVVADPGCPVEPWRVPGGSSPALLGLEMIATFRRRRPGLHRFHGQETIRFQLWTFRGRMLPSERFGVLRVKKGHAQERWLSSSRTTELSMI